MKKNGTALLCLILALSMTACSSGSSSSADSTTSADSSTSESNSEYLTLGEYTGFTVDKEVVEITDDDVEAEIESQLDENADAVDSTEAAEEEDYVSLDFTLTVDGETIAEEEDYEVVIGAGYLETEVEEKLVGAEAGDELEVSATLGSGYGDDYEGKTGEYTIEVNRVYYYVTPELNEDYVKEYTVYSTVDEYKEGIRESLEEDAETSSQEEAGMLAIQMAVDNATISGYSQDLYDSLYAENEEEYEFLAEMFGMEREDIISDDDLASTTLSDIYTQMVVEAIAEKEGLELTDEEYDAYLSDSLDAYGYETVEELEEDYEEDDLKSDALYSKVMNFILDTCTLNEMSSEDYEEKYYSDDEEEESDEEDESEEDSEETEEE